MMNTKHLKTTLLLLASFLGYSSYLIAEDVEKNLFEQANQILMESNRSEKQARALILAANKTRQSISNLRAASRKESDETKKNEVLGKANKLAEELQFQQEQGAKLRIDSLTLRARSHQLLQEAFVTRWQKWVNNQAPLTMDKETLNYIAHNAQVRSVHPSMLNKMGSAIEAKSGTDKSNFDHSMTLQVPALISQNAPPDLNIDAFRFSNNQHYFGHIEVNSDTRQNMSNVAQVPLNQMHQWRLLISDTFGNPVNQANIEVVGHMPGHVHGLPTQPKVTKELADGVYLVEGLKFQMQGWWVMQFNITENQADEKSIANENNVASKLTDQSIKKKIADTLTFNLIL